MDIGVKINAYGRVLLFAIAAIIVTLIVKVFVLDSKEPKLNQAGSAVTDSAINSNEQHNRSLVMDESKKLPISMSLLASSVQDRNAVIRQVGQARVVSVGDEIAEGELIMKVIQVSDQQLVLRLMNSNDLYLVSTSIDGAKSKIQKVSSDIALSEMVPIGSSVSQKH